MDFFSGIGDSLSGAMFDFVDNASDMAANVASGVGESFFENGGQGLQMGADYLTSGLFSMFTGGQGGNAHPSTPQQTIAHNNPSNMTVNPINLNGNLHNPVTPVNSQTGSASSILLLLALVAGGLFLFNK